MATYKFYYCTTTDDYLEEEYVSDTNIKDIDT